MRRTTSATLDSIYWQLAQFLYELIRDADTPEDIDQLGEILDETRDLLDEHCSGIGTELWLWIGLLEPQGDRKMARDYQKGIEELFQERSTMNSQEG